jgi:hypothetical protein
VCRQAESSWLTFLKKCTCHKSCKSLLVTLCVVRLKVAGVLGRTLVFLLLLLLLALAATAAATAATAALLLLFDELLPQLLDEAAVVGVYNLHPLILNTAFT